MPAAAACQQQQCQQRCQQRRRAPAAAMSELTIIAWRTSEGGMLAGIIRDSQRLHVTAELDWKRIE